MRMRRGAVILVWLAVRPALADVVGLSDLEQQTLKARPEPRAAKIESLQAEAAVAGARAAYYPQVNALADGTVAPGGELIEITQDGHTFKVSGTRDISEPGSLLPIPRVTVGVQAKALLYDFGRTAAEVRSAEAKVSAAAARSEAASHELRLQVRGAYLRWIAVFSAAREAAAAARAAEARRARVEALITEGARPAADRAEAVAAEATARLQAIRAEGALERARRDLSDVVGAPLAPNAEPDMSLLETPAAPAEGNGGSALTALAAQQASAVATAERYDIQHRPLLTAAAQAGVREQDANVFPVYEFGVQLSIPLFDGGSQEARAAVARAEAEGYAVRMEALHAQGERAEAASREASARAEQEIEAAQALVTAAENRLKLAEERYEQGAGSLETIAETRGALLEARGELVQARLHRAAVKLGVASP
jgi:outer membrane protein TolC